MMLVRFSGAIKLAERGNVSKAAIPSALRFEIRLIRVGKIRHGDSHANFQDCRARRYWADSDDRWTRLRGCNRGSWELLGRIRQAVRFRDVIHIVMRFALCMQRSVISRVKCSRVHVTVGARLSLRLMFGPRMFLDPKT